MWVELIWEYGEPSEHKDPKHQIENSTLVCLGRLSFVRRASPSRETSLHKPDAALGA